MNASPVNSASGLSSIHPHPGTVAHTAAASLDRVEVVASAASGRPGLRIETDLADAVAYWSPGLRGRVALPADWSEGAITSIVESAPAGALYNAGGRVILAWAANQMSTELSIQTGVSEEGKSFIIDICPARPVESDLVVLVDTTHDSLGPTVAALAEWMSRQGGVRPLTPPTTVNKPVYSTWYTFTQDIDARRVADEAALATELGCGAVFIDDGWQQHADGRGYQGCGDWVADIEKFPDLGATVTSIQERGSAVGLWLAPLLLGEGSAAHAILATHAPRWQDQLHCFVLDPREQAVRRFVADTCLRLVNDYRVDVLKIDFLDQAMVYAGTTSTGDVADVGEAMDRMLHDVRHRIANTGRRIAFEFRQPYVSPTLAQYGEILRANDCPGDSLTNRAATLDSRLFAVGQVVHSDPLMWGRTGGPEAVAQQLYSGWFAVPQISMPLSTLPGDQSSALRGLLDLWADQAEVTQHGTLTIVGAERGYDLVTATRNDLQRQVVARYADLVVDLQSPPERVDVINATHSDRIVLRLGRPFLHGQLHSSSGTTTSNLQPAGPGLIEVSIPAFGSISLRFAR